VPHFKCTTCKTRLYNPEGSAHLLDELCASCGSALERPDHLSELVGFRAITPHDRPADGGSRAAEAVALPRPETTC
jgi:hypothetical protein